ncbi:MAG TPA: pyridoxine 5'-phosphate synthase [Gammaproteobacteria bacterium]|nr:pyridoxine 5'-phosphate synthase [Gammaproteobacteria bacterium]
MTMLSVNVNKIALLRNSRGRDFPNLCDFVGKLVNLKVKGITVHPRPDERHVTRQDVSDLAGFLELHPDVEFNIEGYPSSQFMELVLAVRPAQCTLVPDEPGQLTSDHGWNVSENKELLTNVLADLRSAGIRSSIFLDPDPETVVSAKQVGADRIELYTEDFAHHFGLESEHVFFEAYRATAARAQELGVGVNAGHDLDIKNLGKFLQIPQVLEVSIGHALVVELIQYGLESVIGEYLAICAGEVSETHYY